MLTECPECRYSLAGLPANHRCPECGFEYDDEMICWRRRGKPRFSRTSFLILGTMPILWFVGAPPLVVLVAFAMFAARPMYELWQAKVRSKRDYLCVGRGSVRWRRGGTLRSVDWSEMQRIDGCSLLTGNMKLLRNDGTVEVISGPLCRATGSTDDLEKRMWTYLLLFKAHESTLGDSCDGHSSTES